MQSFLLPLFSTFFIGTLVPLPEEAVLLGLSVSASSLPGLLPMVVAACLGLYVRDLTLFLFGRYAGRAVFRHPLAIRFLGTAPLERLQERAERNAVGSVVAARMAFGVRVAAQISLGAAGVPLHTHLAVNGLLLLVWVPFVMGLGLWFHDPAVAALSWCGDNKVLLVAFFLIILAAWATKRMSMNAQDEAEHSPA